VGLPGEQEEARSPGNSRSPLQNWQRCRENSAVWRAATSEAGKPRGPSRLPPSPMLRSAASGLRLVGRARGRRGLKPGMWEASSHPSVPTCSPPTPQPAPAGDVAPTRSASLPQKVPWPCPGLSAAPTSPQMSNLTASLVFPGCVGMCGGVFPLPTPSPSPGKAPAVSPRERLVRHSMKQLQIIKGLNGASEKSRELATSINSSPCQAA